MIHNTQTYSKTETISTAELAKRIKQPGAFEFWNVLTQEYYSRENIKGSRHVPLDQIGREVATKNFPRDTEIVVYCGGPKCPQSHMAADKLKAFGFTNVKVYEGGLEEWEAAGLPIEQDERQPMVCH